MRSIACSRCALALLLALLAMPAVAQQTTASPKEAGALWKPVAPDVLERSRGGQSVHNEMELTGTTADNTARNVTTGSNAISSGSFAHMSGLPVVIQNTGANVLIQNAVILHLQMD